MKALLVAGSVLVLAAIACWLLRLPSLTLILALLGLTLLLASLFRRYGRPGDVRRSAGPWS